MKNLASDLRKTFFTENETGLDQLDIRTFIQCVLDLGDMSVAASRVTAPFFLESTYDLFILFDGD